MLEDSGSDGIEEGRRDGPGVKRKEFSGVGGAEKGSSIFYVGGGVTHVQLPASAPSLHCVGSRDHSHAGFHDCQPTPYPLSHMGQNPKATTRKAVRKALPL